MVAKEKKKGGLKVGNNHGLTILLLLSSSSLSLFSSPTTAFLKHINRLVRVYSTNFPMKQSQRELKQEDLYEDFLLSTKSLDDSLISHTLSGLLKQESENVAVQELVLYGVGGLGIARS